MRAIVLVVLLLPTAAACSFAGPVPEPAAFTLVPDAGGANVTIPIEGRMSGAGCELSNAHVLADGTFAWLEYDWNPNARTVHLLDLATGERRVVTLKSAETTNFGLWNGSLLYHAHDFTNGIPPASHFYRHDIATDRAVELPFPAGNYPKVVFDGPLIAASLLTNGFEGPDHFYLYDAAAGRFLVEGIHARELVGEEFVWPGPMGDGWLVLGGVRTPQLYEIATGALFNTTPDMEHAIAIIDGAAWGWSSEGDTTHLWQRALPNGTRSEEAAPAGRIVGKVPGYTVLGEYSAPHLASPSRLLGAAPWLIGVGLVLAAPIWWLARRHRSS